MALHPATLLAATVLLLAGSAAANTCSYCNGSGNRLSCYVATDYSPLCEWQDNYKYLPSCFDSSYMRSSSGSYCEGSDESHACPDSITAGGVIYALMGLRPWDGDSACPDAWSTSTECSGEVGCFSEPEWVRKLLSSTARRGRKGGAKRVLRALRALGEGSAAQPEAQQQAGTDVTGEAASAAPRAGLGLTKTKQLRLCFALPSAILAA
ncbi:hypothetical protein ABPG75_009645 [Micractinium tetrahymenae]